MWLGAAVTALLFELGKFGLSFYLGRESTASSFGAAGSVVLILLWVYYASCILLFGAEFTQVYSRETGHDILPASGAVPVTAESRAQQGLAPVGAIGAAAPSVQTRFIEVRPPNRSQSDWPTAGRHRSQLCGRAARQTLRRGSAKARTANSKELCRPRSTGRRESGGTASANTQGNRQSRKLKKSEVPHAHSG